ncbi:kinesin-Like protein [Salpingoeca rosetta]|uniref:Kinesin-Like protein n=1 Tax=Salpingoeca rosetta (strain ATCC 50818 / BSB-021) TaxID=946362 RepID=F2TYK6_SALR5|nr:kinesin-Like protein [Salpingoeca rosetta]EGD78680.1 kinesin-Like protein [Salpingoeca rosetta]|eukprot:XP_004997637.1 kinesin-Like protein [Salpingoeca rosetta]
MATNGKRTVRRRASVSHGVGGSDAVRVAVRVRPFNSRELHSAARCVVEMKGSQTILQDPSGTRQPRPFTFDYSYWSFDGFETQPDGTIVKKADNYADQETVYRDLGKDAVKDAMDGYNAAIFAYGQTGAGKSFTMVGYNANEGIIPRLTRDLFRETAISRASPVGDAASSPARPSNNNNNNNNGPSGAPQGSHSGGIEYQVTFSMLEIYNERITDLLSSAGGELKLRQHPKQGFYVQGLQKVAVSSYDDVRKRMDLGVRNRTTAATTMNETSSRSHMVVTLHVKQIFLNTSGESTTKYSDIHLVDLAGSERAEASAAVSDRLKEGAAINQSLSTLGNVISALAERGAGRTDVVVPYRNSALTKLLHNALGGNSKTNMIAAISPAAINYEETLSTLRYADRAKQIRNKAVVNESPTDKLIRELREENARLMAVLSEGGMTPEQLAEVRADKQLLGREVADLETQWSKQLEAARQEWEQQLSLDDNLLALAQQSEIQADAHLSNINPDPQLSHVIKHVLPEGVTMVARLDNMDEETLDEHSDLFADVDHILEMSGPSIQQRHCKLERKGTQVVLTPEPVGGHSIGGGGDGATNSGGAGNGGVTSEDVQVRVNGEVVAPGHARALQHLDRVVFGPGQAYLYFAEQSARESDTVADVQNYDYDFVQMEIASAQGLGQFLRASTNLSMDPDTQRLRQALVAVAPMVTTANAISAELKRGVRFEIVVKTGTTHALNDKSKEVLVQVTDTTTGFVWRWDRAKFVNRCELMKMMFNERQKEQRERRGSQLRQSLERKQQANKHRAMHPGTISEDGAVNGSSGDGGGGVGAGRKAKAAGRGKGGGGKKSKSSSVLPSALSSSSSAATATTSSSKPNGGGAGYAKIHSSSSSSSTGGAANGGKGKAPRRANSYSSALQAKKDQHKQQQQQHAVAQREHTNSGDELFGMHTARATAIATAVSGTSPVLSSPSPTPPAGVSSNTTTNNSASAHANDPFWDPPEDLFLGSSFVYLQPLAFGVGVDETLPVTDYRGLTVALLDVHVSLCDHGGKTLPDFALVQDPSDFADRRVDVLVRIDRARDVEWVQQDTTRGVACRYRFYTDAKKRTTREVYRSPQAAEFAYSKQFTIRTCSPNFVNYLKTNVLVLELWGKQGDGTTKLRRQHTGGLLSATMSLPGSSSSSSSSRRGGGGGTGGGGDGSNDRRNVRGKWTAAAATALSSSARAGDGAAFGGEVKSGRAMPEMRRKGETGARFASTQGKKTKTKGSRSVSVGDDSGAVNDSGLRSGVGSAIGEGRDDGDGGDDDGGGDGDGGSSRDPVARDFERQMDAVVMEAMWLEEKRRLQAVIEDLQQEVEFLQIEKGQLEKEMSVIVLEKTRTSSSLEKDSLHDVVDAFTTKHRNLHRRLNKAMRTNKKADTDAIAQELQAECDGLEAVANQITRQMMTVLTDVRSTITHISRS